MADNVLAQVPRKRYPTLDEQMRSDIVNYLSRLKSDFVTSGERAGQGLGQVIDDGNYLEGVPRVVLGGLGALSAPVSAAVSPVLGPLLQPVGEAVDTYVGQPIEQATGYPADITNELFLTGVTAGAAPVLRPALRGSGNFLAKVGDAAEAGLNRVGYTARPQAGTFFSGVPLSKLDDALDSSPEAVAQRAYDQGFRIDAYTGANRLDRLVQGIDPQRATSGPMPYFTDAPDLASQYAVNKIDNSAIRELGDWDTQFTVGGKPLSQFSKSLTPMQKRDLAARFENIGLDDDGNVVTTVGQPGGANLDHWKYLLKYHKGDPIAAAKELWLESGQIFGNESDFATVLQKAGLNDVEFDSPNISYPGVLPAKLKIENPLITTDRTTLRDLLPELEKAAQSAPKPQYTSGGVDQWDKTTLDPADWIERYRTDLQNGTAHAWTVVPDWVTEFLKSRGFDGIKDVGGKMGGSPHTVWIPFSPEQVRSRFARFDPKNIGKAGLSLGVAGGVGLANQEENGSAIYRQMEGGSGGT